MGLYFTKAQGLEFGKLAIKTNSCPVMPESWTGSKWENEYHKFQEFMKTGVPQWKIFVVGNRKLGKVIIAWSTLPLLTCPGAGYCRIWCYSFKAWMHPEAYFRQLQNTILIMRQSEYIVEAFHKLDLNGDLRLYVDGDIDSKATLEFWHRLLLQRPDLNAYGYSKSWQIFQEYDGPIAPNYKLNLSSGSIYGEAMKQRMLKLQVTRGEFIAVASMGTNQHRDMPEEKRSMPWTEWVAQIKTQAKAQGHSKVFVCPGNCETCTPNGHFCGSSDPKAQGVTVAIGVH